MSASLTLSAKLDRTDSSTPWGFRLYGGVDFGVPLNIQKVNPGSLAARCGLQVGDVVTRIGGSPTDRMRHKEAQEQIIMAGNSLELSLQRGGAGAPPIRHVDGPVDQSSAFTPVHHPQPAAPKHGGGGAKPFGSSYGGHDSYGNNNNNDFRISNLSIRSQPQQSQGRSDGVNSSMEHGAPPTNTPLPDLLSTSPLFSTPDLVPSLSPAVTGDTDKPALRSSSTSSVRALQKMFESGEVSGVRQFVSRKVVPSKPVTNEKPSSTAAILHDSQSQFSPPSASMRNNANQVGDFERTRALVPSTTNGKANCHSPPVRNHSSPVPSVRSTFVRTHSQTSASVLTASETIHSNVSTPVPNNSQLGAPALVQSQKSELECVSSNVSVAMSQRSPSQNATSPKASTPEPTSNVQKANFGVTARPFGARERRTSRDFIAAASATLTPPQSERAAADHSQSPDAGNKMTPDEKSSPRSFIPDTKFSSHTKFSPVNNRISEETKVALDNTTVTDSDITPNLLIKHHITDVNKKSNGDIVKELGRLKDKTITVVNTSNTWKENTDASNSNKPAVDTDSVTCVSVADTSVDGARDEVRSDSVTSVSVGDTSVDGVSARDEVRSDSVADTSVDGVSARDEVRSDSVSGVSVGDTSVDGISARDEVRSDGERKKITLSGRVGKRLILDTASSTLQSDVEAAKPCSMISERSDAAPYSPSAAPYSPSAKSPSAWQPQVPTGPRNPKFGKRGEARSLTQGSGRIPVCSTCGVTIRGPFVMALDKTWCPDHFVCGNPNCRRPLVDVGFVEEQGQLFCERDYEAYFAPHCGRCNAPIVGEVVNALKNTFHVSCFVCVSCRQPIGSGSFHLEEGKIYCKKDWAAMFQTKCHGCQFPIEPGDRWVEALGQNWHSECFNCSTCQANLEGQSFFAKAGRPYCKKHAAGGRV